MTDVATIAVGTVYSSWREQAKCIGMDQSIFFLEHGQRADAARIICNSCKVKIECLQDTIDHPLHDVFGVRGGYTPRERRDLRVQIEREVANA